MLIPLANRCLPQTIDISIVSRFRSCNRADKASVLQDAMTLWELIKDCFNRFNHYAALSHLFDLVQLEKENNDPGTTWQRRWEIVKASITLGGALDNLIDTRYTVMVWTATDDVPPYVAVGFMRSGDYDGWWTGTQQGAPEVLLQITLRLIDNVRFLAVWRSLRHAFAYADRLQAIEMLSNVLDEFLDSASRFNNFQALKALSTDPSAFVALIDGPSLLGQAPPSKLCFGEDVLAVLSASHPTSNQLL